jgi:ABC-type Fe3+/spermidine/putrescine transport system ATPase subunit
MTSAEAGDGHLEVRGVSHAYGRQQVLRDIDLEVRDGEFVTFLGPSGCGKTTLLRTIAGFIEPRSGTITLGGADLTRMPAHKRPVNMVFQRSTLFPHLNVRDNVAFGLKVDRLPKAEIAERVAWGLDLVRLGGYEERRASELSGGQLQRVALARALVKRPQVLLLDEPLSALDLKIRLEMEVELRRVHRETGSTWIYVTHDQREALALSDRIAVFDHGQIDQLAEPTAIYRAPATPHAARFVGNANVLACEVRDGPGGPVAVIAGRELALGAGVAERGSAWLVLRPENVRVAPGGTDGATVQAVVRDVAYRGTAFSYELGVDGLGEPLKAEVPAGPGHPVDVGAPVGVTWDAEAAIVLARDAGEAPPEDPAQAEDRPAGAA